MNDVALKQSAHPAVIPHESGSLLEAVLRAASDPAVDPSRLRELLEIGERLEARQAKQRFDEALREMEPELPVVTKRGEIIYKAGTKGTKYAKWDDIHRACMPVLHKHGFSCSFTSELQGTNALRVIIRVKGWGHEEQGSLVVPWLDAGGSKSPAQQAASSETLGMRHAFVKFFNILTEDKDDDGSGRGVPERITEEQFMHLDTLVAAMSDKDPAFKGRFEKRLKAELQCERINDLFQGEQWNTVLGWFRK